MAANTCTNLIIHPAFQPSHLNATHSNISFGISLRNLANQKSFASENHSFFTEDSTFVVQPLNVAAPSNTIMIDSDSDEEDSIICDQASTSSHNPEQMNQIVVNDIISTDTPSTSNQMCLPVQTTIVSLPPTLLLDSIILKEVCENIYKDLNKLVKSKSNLIHNQDYVSAWTSLRERVEDMMCELQKLRLDAHDKALVELREWFKEVAQNMEEININRNQKLYLSNIPIYMDASRIISSSVKYEDPDVKWLTTLLIKSEAPILEKLKKYTALQKENKELKKALFEQRLLTIDLQKKLIAQQEEAKESE